MVLWFLCFFFSARLFIVYAILYLFFNFIILVIVLITILGLSTGFVEIVWVVLMVSCLLFHLSCFITFTICAIGIIIKIAEIFDYFNAYQNSRNFTKHLLQNGRKSLATVRDVQYRANSEEQYPEFVLRYAFNPPDDSAPDDLIHEVVVPYDPALKPEDVLPILYTVSEDSTEVMSMPFSFPTKALPELSSCYCKTSNGVIQSS